MKNRTQGKKEKEETLKSGEKWRAASTKNVKWIREWGKNASEKARVLKIWGKKSKLNYGWDRNWIELKLNSLVSLAAICLCIHGASCTNFVDPFLCLCLFFCLHTRFCTLYFVLQNGDVARDLTFLTSCFPRCIPLRLDHPPRLRQLSFTNLI